MPVTEERRAQLREAAKTFREKQRAEGAQKLSVWISKPAAKRLNQLAKTTSKDAVVEALIMDTRNETS